MNTDIEIQTAVDLLRSEATDTKTLYREVCGLLFFRFGITPTTNKLYQLVRKGSMSVPTEVLAQFWRDLRERSSINLEQPDLPTSVQVEGGKLVQALWSCATQQAREELRALREDAVAETDLMRSRLHQLETQLSTALEESRIWKEKHDRLMAEWSSLSNTLSLERVDHQALRSTADKQFQQLIDLQAEMTCQRQAAAQELADAHQKLAKAQSAAEASERRALLLMDQTRQAQLRHDKQANALRQKIAEGEQILLEARSSLDEAQAHLKAAQSTEALHRHRAEEALRQADESRSSREQLALQLVQQKAEANTLRGLLAQRNAHPVPAKSLRRRRSPAATPK